MAGSEKVNVMSVFRAVRDGNQAGEPTDTVGAAVSTLNFQDWSTRWDSTPPDSYARATVCGPSASVRSAFTSPSRVTRSAPDTAFPSTVNVRTPLPGTNRESSQLMLTGRVSMTESGGGEMASSATARLPWTMKNAAAAMPSTTTASSGQTQRRRRLRRPPSVGSLPTMYVPVLPLMHPGLSRLRV